MENITLYYEVLKGSGSSAGGHSGDGENWKHKYEEQVALNKKLEAKIKELEEKLAQFQSKTTTETPKESEKAPEKKEDFDLFGDDEEDDSEHQKLIEQRAQEALKKKAEKGKQVVLKSAVLIDIKPWDDTTDLKALEVEVRKIEMEGLEWKASKIAPVAFGINKLSISCHMVDDVVSVDELQERIQAMEEFVQSTVIASFTKL